MGQSISFGPDEICETGINTTSEPAPLTLCQLVGQNWSPDFQKIGSGGSWGNVVIGNASTYLQYSTMPVNQRIWIAGTFVIDVPFSFTDCDVKMDASANIIVKSELISNRSKFFSCAGMWQGIKIEEEGRLFLQNFTSIEDANRAVEATEEASLISISRTTFNRNKVGILFTSSTLGKTTSIRLQAFYKNVFTCTSMLNDGSWASAGISIFAVAMPNLGQVGSLINTDNINTANSYANRFEGKIRVGIELYAAVANIKLCKFVNIENGSNSSSGTGITATLSDLTFSGLGVPTVIPSDAYVPPVNLATFLNCQQGAILSTNSKLNVQKTYFEFSSSLARPLKSLGPVVKSTGNTRQLEIIVSNNYFNIYAPYVSGINISRSLAENSVENNIFTTKNLNSSTEVIEFIQAIQMSKGSSNGTKSAQIINNKIYNFHYSIYLRGIDLDQGTLYTVKDNLVSRLSVFNKLSFGLAMRRCSGINTVTNNKVVGYTPHSTPVGATTDGTGFYFFETSLKGIFIPSPSLANAPAGFKICNNIAENCEDGFLFLGEHAVTFAENEMKENRTGLRIAQSKSPKPAIGEQWFMDDYRTNIWKGKQGVTTGASNAVLETGDPKLSRFHTPDRQVYNCNDAPYNCSKIAYDNIQVPPGYSKEDWFKNKGVFDIKCGNNGGNLQSDWTPIDEEVLHENYNGESAVTAWESKRALYHKLVTYPELQDADIDRFSFVQDNREGNIPIFNQIQIGIADLFSMTTEQSIRWTNLHDEYESAKAHWEEWVRFNNELYGDTPWPQEVNLIYATFSDDLDIVNQKLIELSDQLSQQAMTRAQNLLVINNEWLHVADEHEIIAQKVNRLWLNYILTNGVLNEEEKQQAKSIAQNCFTVAGTAKYQALNLLTRCEVDELREDLCESEARVISNTPTKEHKLLVAPNPAADYIQISTEDWTAIELLSVHGQRLQYLSANKSNDSYLDVGHLISGVYLLKVTYDDGIQKVQKVNIIH